MNSPRIALFAATLVLATPFILLAQQKPPVAPGDRVRVSRLGTVPPLVCTVLALKADTLVLDAEDRVAPLELPLALVKKVEVSRGQKSNAGNGALTGGLVGAAFGSVVAFAALLEGGSDKVAFAAGSVAVLGSFGAGLGLLGGAATRSERWDEVPLDRIRVGPTCDRRGLALSVSIRL